MTGMVYSLDWNSVDWRVGCIDFLTLRRQMFVLLDLFMTLVLNYTMFHSYLIPLWVCGLQCVLSSFDVSSLRVDPS